VSVEREYIHDLIDQQLNDWKYGEKVPIENGRLIFEVQIENSQVTLVTKERERKVVKKGR